MGNFFVSLLESPFFILLLFLIPVLNGIACFLIFKRIIIKVLLGIILVPITFVLNVCCYLLLYFFLFSIFMHGKPVGTEPPSFYRIHKVITILICGCFTVWLYKIGINNAEMRKQD